MYVYIESEPGLWTVGFYDPTGKWHPESDHNRKRDAAYRVIFLNGGEEEPLLDFPSNDSGLLPIDTGIY